MKRNDSGRFTVSTASHTSPAEGRGLTTKSSTESKNSNEVDVWQFSAAALLATLISGKSPALKTWAGTALPSCAARSAVGDRGHSPALKTTWADTDVVSLPLWDWWTFVVNLLDTLLLELQKLPPISVRGVLEPSPRDVWVTGWASLSPGVQNPG